jgi:flagellin
LDITSQASANAAINVLDNALGKVLNQQTTLGALQSRMLFTSANINTASENTQASMSIIRDADMAKEMTAYVKANVLSEASQAMLSQANQNSSSVLSLLG